MREANLSSQFTNIMNRKSTMQQELDMNKVNINKNNKLSTDTVVCNNLQTLMTDSKYKEIMKAITTNTRRGLGFRMNVGEQVVFNSKETLPIIVTGFETSKGKLLPSCSAWVVSSRQGTIEFPMSIFRRIPSDIEVDLVYEDGRVVRSYVHDDEHYKELIEEGRTVEKVGAIDYLCKDNPVGDILLKPIDDFKRALALADKMIECTEKIYLFRPLYEDGRRVQGKFESIAIYKFKFVEE